MPTASLFEHQADVLKDDKANSKATTRSEEKAIDTHFQINSGKFCDACHQRRKDLQFCLCHIVKYCSLESQKRY